MQISDKAGVLVEALPYIQKFRNSIMVVKFGGSAMEDESLVRRTMQDIVMLEAIGIRPVVVHGGGKAISAALKKGKAPVDIQVENALLKRALGQIVKVKKPIKLKHKGQIPGKGFIEEERIEYAEEEVYIPPDTTAQIFWLKNRRPDKWRDKVEGAPEGNNDLLQSLLDLERRAAQ
jgi:hypothetical protein